MQSGQSEIFHIYLMTLCQWGIISDPPDVDKIILYGATEGQRETINQHRLG